MEDAQSLCAPQARPENGRVQAKIKQAMRCGEDEPSADESAGALTVNWRGSVTPPMPSGSMPYRTDRRRGPRRIAAGAAKRGSGMAESGLTARFDETKPISLTMIYPDRPRVSPSFALIVRIAGSAQFSSRQVYRPAVFAGFPDGNPAPNDTLMARTVGSSGFSPAALKRACSSVSISDFLNGPYRLKKIARASGAQV